MGMSRTDFLSLTVPEFSGAYSAWREISDHRDRQAWEVMRVQTAMTLQPFVKTRLDPKRLFPLPWDNSHHAPRLSREERRVERQRQQERLSRYLKTGVWDA